MKRTHPLRAEYDRALALANTVDLGYSDVGGEVRLCRDQGHPWGPDRYYFPVVIVVHDVPGGREQQIRCGDVWVDLRQDRAKFSARA